MKDTDIFQLSLQTQFEVHCSWQVNAFQSPFFLECMAADIEALLKGIVKIQQ